MVEESGVGVEGIKEEKEDSGFGIKGVFDQLSDFLDRLSKKIEASEATIKRLEKMLKYLSLEGKEEEARKVLELLSNSTKEDLRNFASVMEKIKGSHETGEEISRYRFSPDDRSELEVTKRLIQTWRDLKKEGIRLDDISEDGLKKTGLTARIAGILSHAEIIKLSEKYTEDTPLIDVLEYILGEVDALRKLMNKHYQGIGLLRKGAYKEACECFKTMIDIDSGLKGAWLNRGVALGCLGEIDEEIGCYNMALAIDPNYEKALKNARIAESHLKNQAESDRRNKILLMHSEK